MLHGRRKTLFPDERVLDGRSFSLPSSRVLQGPPLWLMTASPEALADADSERPEVAPPLLAVSKCGGGRRSPSCRPSPPPPARRGSDAWSDRKVWRGVRPPGCGAGGQRTGGPEAVWLAERAGRHRARGGRPGPGRAAGAGEAPTGEAGAGGWRSGPTEEENGARRKGLDSPRVKVR